MPCIQYNRFAHFFLLSCVAIRRELESLGHVSQHHLVGHDGEVTTPPSLTFVALSAQDPHVVGTWVLLLGNRGTCHSTGGTLFGTAPRKHCFGDWFVSGRACPVDGNRIKSKIGSLMNNFL